ncbi:MAG: putative permease [Herbinix sp.]|nr:putative permease [Herbinix sp.]
MGYLFLLAFSTSVIGAICGVGGGILIKPVLDATGFMNVSMINFLSSCTVLSMAVISVSRTIANKRHPHKINLLVGTPIAIGAAIGGSAGKILFTIMVEKLSADHIVGVIQSAVLLIITILTLFYYLFCSRITTLHLSNPICIIIIGFFLGILSSFLGIGGGPINIVILSYFFSMEKRESMVNSLYIILFSQITSLVYTIITGNIPQDNMLYLLCMIAGGMIGGNVGCFLNHKIKASYLDRLFLALLFIIIIINCFNIFTFFHKLISI